MRPAVQQRQQVAEQIALRLLGALVGDAPLAEQLARKLAGVAVAGHFGDAIGLQQDCEVVDDGFGAERRSHLAGGIDHDALAVAVTDGHREAVGAAAARIDERGIVLLAESAPSRRGRRRSPARPRRLTKSRCRRGTGRGIRRRRGVVALQARGRRLTAAGTG